MRYLLCLAIGWGVLCMTVPSSVRAHAPRFSSKLTTASVVRATKAAQWLLARRKFKQPFLERSVPSVLLVQWLPAMARLDEHQRLRGFERAMKGFGYPPALSSFFVWRREWEAIMRAFDAVRWKLSETSRKGLLARRKALPKTGLTKEQTKQKALLSYKLSLLSVPASARALVRAQLVPLRALFRTMWRSR